MSNSRNTSNNIRTRKKQTLPRRLSKRQRFHRGLIRYNQKKLDFGWKAFIRRIEYRNMLWERAPPLFIGFTFFLALSILIIDALNVGLENSPIVIVFLLILLIITSILEIWYVGGDKNITTFGRKIRRKKFQREQEDN